MRTLVCHVDDLDHDGVATRAVGRADVAVVVDVVRAFTVAPWCLHRGAARLLLARGVEEAVAARAARFPDALLLKDGDPDERFALPNAPGRIALEDLSGRTVLQRTGNGTRGAHAVAGVPLVLCAGLVTASATAAAVAAAGAEHVVLVVTEGEEDVALAELVLAVLEHGSAVDPEPFRVRAAGSEAAQQCRDRGPDPAWPGFHEDDLRRCLQVDRFDRAVVAREVGDGLLEARWHG